MIIFFSLPNSLGAHVPEGGEARCSQGKGCILWNGTQARLGGGVRKKQKPAARRAHLRR
jgi:hypothetical protein